MKINELSKKIAPEPKDLLITIVVILFGTIFPRLMVVGGLPFTDEGVYAYQAQFIHANLVLGKGLPDSGSLMLYPLLSSWIFGLAGNHIVLLRFLDMFIATVASFLISRVIERECGSRLGGALISFIFIFTMNLPLFIECGFKNSIFAAYVPIFLAFLLADKSGSDINWLMIGALVALAVLLREPFLIFLIVGVAAITKVYGWRAGFKFVLGASISTATTIALVAFSRGGLMSIFNSYRDAGVLYSSVSGLRLYFLEFNGLQFINESKRALILAGLGMSIAIFCLIKSHRTTSLGRLFFWAALILAPLIEPVSKIGFPYHFAVCLPGLGGITALGWNWFSSWGGPKARLWLSVFLSFAVLSSIPQFISLVKKWPDTRATIASIATGSWPKEDVSKSNYLIAAEAIRRVAAPDSTLGISGFMLALYPLTGLLPPSNDMSNLSATLIKFHQDGLRFKNALIDCPPDVLMTTTRTDWPGADILRQAVIDSGLYVQVINIPVVEGKAYGNFAGDIYVRTNMAPINCML